MVRAIICCTALIFNLLAPFGATAQSAEKARPLDLRAFMRGNVKTTARPVARSATAKTGKHRHGRSRSAARPGKATGSATLPPPAPLPAAATAYASHAENEAQSDVAVVTSDQINAIDLAMLGGSPETVGAALKVDGTDIDVSVRPASHDGGELRDSAKPGHAAASSGEPGGRGDGAPRNDSWTGRIWSAIGDGFVALSAMLRQLFG